jgi:hypothetical protein
VTAVIGLGAVVSACGTSGTALAQQACSHVNESIKLLDGASHQSDSQASAAVRQKAYLQLRDALPIAAEAAYADGQWQALMTTVAESNRVVESTLVPALQQQCQQADTSVFGGQQAPPSSIPPPAPASSSP